jgi:preprotein translocase subunit SecB
VSQQPEIAASGYTLEQIYFVEQSHRLLERTAEMPEQAVLQFGWNWKITEEALFEVMLHLELGASQVRPEETRVFICGRFGVVGKPELPITDFVRLHGPTILIPYAREAISALTSRSFFGPQYLPPLNVAKLMVEMDPTITIGAQQLREREVGAKAKRSKVEKRLPRGAN